MSIRPVHVAGGGLAGCEAALQLARFGIPVVLHEMRPARETPAHQGEALAQIVCSNSLKSVDPTAASGLFKAELASAGCRLLAVARACAVPAGAALAVDKELFSSRIEALLAGDPLIEIVRDEVTAPDVAGDAFWIIATGPLTSADLRLRLEALTGGAGLYFFDAIAPTVTLDSLDLDALFRAARYGKGEADYLNAPLTRPEYEAFHAALTGAARAGVRDFDRSHLFAGCQPIEEIADSGLETMAFGPLRPVGLADPRTGKRPHAVVQLRQENRAGTLYGLVGFQTRLKRAEQRRVFRMIPGLGRAEFVRYGQLHRNFYLDTPRVLDRAFALAARPRLRFAGQITGVEGYVESIASGLTTAWSLAAELRGMRLPPWPSDTLLGALLHGFLFDGTGGRLTPMNVNFGLLPPLAQPPRGRGARRQRREALSARSRESLTRHLRSPSLQRLLAADSTR
ncbi:methylenetetrahydrofolate--tRNA-(uracil(54)-C(5))-methyltransferase (FADH(2)-oxidizing) TrmFO [bacterium]|nr:methylenetetrahydrofolate--tRNA-(uracil(54)-C(5))-methyltransferase (FADH(2)-oxidizing) TrmFO [bacterium]MBU1072586.1 methylenetetrahydrofolate--tRNA-(uracil(54)-C(5))-methyltransferase (FADH(2)-oxidizing) TrmFO [bacterium]MBU1674168.1 methylenetetrahydrofolate--tRNA-(uracil(54)-C(5))-methyltransferase (FADH(2)-oxidizing) TrmFO [bacterium]